LSYSDALYHLINEVAFNQHQLTPKEKELLMSLYDGEICYLDYCLGLLFERLKALKVYDNTLIIVTSDHGEAFGEHHLLAHGRNLYEELIRIPLIIKYPSTHPQQGVIEKQVSLVDIFPTILDFLDLPIPSGIDGEILAHSNHPIIAEWQMQWFESDKHRRDLKSIEQGKEKYIWASNSLNEYYDLEKDPEEKENLIKYFPQRAETMQDSLNRWLKSFKPPKPKDRNIKIDKSTNEKLRALGYVK
jgi:arylsulfatase A-like enzyme